MKKMSQLGRMTTKKRSPQHGDKSCRSCTTQENSRPEKDQLQGGPVEDHGGLTLNAATKITSATTAPSLGRTSNSRKKAPTTKDCSPPLSISSKWTTSRRPSTIPPETRNQLHQKLDQADLQQCWRRERDHICLDLGANQLQLRRADSSHVIVYSNLERRAQIRCPNGSRSSLLVKGAQTINLSAGRLFTTDTSSLQTRTNVLLPPVMVMRVMWDLDQFLQGDQLHDIIPSLDASRDRYVTPSSHQQQVWRDELRHLQEQHQDDHAIHNYALVIIIGIILLLLIVTALAIARWTYIRAHFIEREAVERPDIGSRRCDTGNPCQCLIPFLPPKDWVCKGRNVGTLRRP
jgi:hypothetical protein